MITMTMQAVAIEDPTTEDFTTDVVHGNNDDVHVDLCGQTDIVKFQDLASYCAQRKYVLKIETVSHTFQNTFERHDVGLEEPDRLWDALDGRR